LEESPSDGEGSYAGPLLEALEEGDGGLLFADGHVVFELTRQAWADSPQALLDEASHAGEDEDELLPLGCAWFPVQAPGRPDGHLHEELAARHEAAAGDLTHGWFASFDAAKASLEACLGRCWSWPDMDACHVLWPHGHQHTATLVYLHGFMCDGASYLRFPEFFYREVDSASARASHAGEEGQEEEEEEEEDNMDRPSYEPFPGLKVVLPTAPKRPITACQGDEHHSWYDYLTDREGEAEDDLDLPSLEEATQRIHALLDEEAAKVGPGRLFLGGTSQGCCVALHAAASYAGPPLGGVLATQGHLLSHSRLPADWKARGTPVRVFHGLADEMMPWESWVSATFEPLRGAGNVSFITEDGVEHNDEEAEGRWVRTFLAEFCGSVGEGSQDPAVEVAAWGGAASAQACSGAAEPQDVAAEGQWPSAGSHAGLAVGAAAAWPGSRTIRFEDGGPAGPAAEGEGEAAASAAAARSHRAAWMRMGSVSDWYNMPDEAQQEKRPPGIGRSLSEWYLDGQLTPSACTPDTAYFTMTQPEDEAGARARDSRPDSVAHR